jgi:hypothetical protein
MGLGPNVALSVLDLSEVAVRFATKATLSARQDVEINFNEASLNRPIKRLGKVLRCFQSDPTTWTAVVRFDRRLEYADIQRLVSMGNV